MRPLYDLASVFANQIQTAELEADRVYEPVIGLVTDNRDPKKLGRVKVKFPILSDSDTSDWAPVIMLGAGKNRGWFFIPEIDDEVLCLFEHGDLERPLIVGALWNGKDTPPDTNPGGNPRRVIKSREGSRIIFDDDQMKIIIEDGTGKGRITFDSNANKITIEAMQGDVCFQAPGGEMKIISASANLKAGANVEFVAGGPLAWGSDGAIDLTGSSGATLGGARVNVNTGAAIAPEMPTSTPQDISDPYGS